MKSIDRLLLLAIADYAQDDGTNAFPSIATLQSEDISHAQLAASLKVIRDKMAKIAQWQMPPPAPIAAVVPAPPRLVTK